MKPITLIIGIAGLFALFLFGCAHKDVRHDPPELTTALSDQNQDAKPSAVDQTLPHQEQTRKETPKQQDNLLEKEEEEVTQIADPLYVWNKGMYYFNDKFYFWLLKPVAQGYSAVFPEGIRISISNFFYNLTTPIRFVNNLLQLKMKTAGNELLRFVVNSTVGVGGLGDFAKDKLDIKRHDEDLGETFGTYGIGHGFYIVWPFLGPSSLRDTVGLVGDVFLDPVSYVTPTQDSLAIYGSDRVNDTSLHIGDYEDIIKAAIDPYISIRDAYVQNRKKKVEE